MSTSNLENTAQLPADRKAPADRILMALKMQGALSSAALGKQLGITGEAARVSVSRTLTIVSSAASPTWARMIPSSCAVRLAWASGKRAWAAGVSRQSCNGRPTPLASLVATTRSCSARRRSCWRAAYQRELAGATDLSAKVATLAGLRSTEGYMANWREEADGSFRLVENHCPISAAAAACADFCRAELDVFLAVLGPSVSVERAEHIIKGDRCCAYVIRPPAAQ